MVPQPPPELVMIPLQASDAIDAMFSNGLGTIISFALQLIVILLLIIAIFLLAGVGLSYASIKSSGQRQAADYVIAFFIVLVVAIIVGSGPEILSELGFSAADNFSAVDVLGG